MEGNAKSCGWGGITLYWSSLRADWLKRISAEKHLKVLADKKLNMKHQYTFTRKKKKERDGGGLGNNILGYIANSTASRLSSVIIWVAEEDFILKTP